MRMCIDCETTGLDPNYNEMISLSFVWDEVVEFKFRITDVNAVSSKALEVNGFTIDELLTFPERDEAIVDLLKWLRMVKGGFGKIRPIGHNYAFDCGFIKSTIGHKNYNELFDYHYMDTMICAQLYDDLYGNLFGRYNLNRLCEVLGVVNDNAHTASSDAIATKAVYEKMLLLFKERNA